MVLGWLVIDCKQVLSNAGESENSRTPFYAKELIAQWWAPLGVPEPGTCFSRASMSILRHNSSIRDRTRVALIRTYLWDKARVINGSMV